MELVKILSEKEDPIPSGDKDNIYSLYASEMSDSVYEFVTHICINSIATTTFIDFAQSFTHAFESKKHLINPDNFSLMFFDGDVKLAGEDKYDTLISDIFLDGKILIKYVSCTFKKNETSYVLV